MSENATNPSETDMPAPALAERAGLIERGIVRALRQMDYAVMREVPLPNHRRADLLAIDRKGQILIVEIKSGRTDFMVDQKWHEYDDYCDAFCFAVDMDFPQELIPETTGLMVTDYFEAETIRPPVGTKLAAARRKALTLKLLRLAAQRSLRVLTVDDVQADNLADDKITEVT